MLERENIDNFIADDLALRNRNWGQIEDELAEKANKQQEDWITPTLLNGWTHHGSYTPLRYMKDTLGFVHISGHVVAGTSTTIFTLPEGYRPIGSNEFLVNTRYNTVEPGLGHVNRVGTVRMTGSMGTGNMVSIHIVFRAER